jgi:general secretion pathway protein M
MSRVLPTLSPARRQLSQRWAGIAPRERKALTVALLIVGLFLVWTTLVQPAWRTVRDAPAAIDKLDAQYQEMQSLAAEVRELRAAAPVSAAQSGEALTAATVRLNESGKIALRGDRAVLTLSNASSEGLRSWLVEARSAARARPMELQLQRSAQGYSGSITVTLSGAP